MSDISNYLEILGKTNEIALATSVNNIPNVRIVNFCFNAERPDILYFASDITNNKIREFEQNNVIAFTTVPADGGIPHVRSVQAAVEKSGHTMDEMAQLFISAISGYDEAIAAIGDALTVFEIHVKETVVITGFEEPGFVTF
jgi:Pyridoxamine 5''-phosphate oxidase.